MNYSVVWSSRAERLLAELWLDPHYRPRLARAVAGFDTLPAANGPDIGESKDCSRRIHLDAPFGIIFRCHEADRRVGEMYVWAY